MALCPFFLLILGSLRIDFNIAKSFGFGLVLDFIKENYYGKKNFRWELNYE